MKALDLVTLPIRAGVLLILWGLAYYHGYGTPREEWRKESPETGLAARYTRNGRPWRIFCDLDRSGKWDRRVDERSGRPYIVSIDDDGDGKPDREEDEWENRFQPAAQRSCGPTRRWWNSCITRGSSSTLGWRCFCTASSNSRFARLLEASLILNNSPALSPASEA